MDTNKSPEEKTKKLSSLSSRLKTAAIALPILFLMLYFRFLYTILMIVVTYLSHSEFHQMQIKILKNIFQNDYYSNLTLDTAMSSPLITLFFVFCPIILYISENSEVFACIIPLSIIVIYRISNFILIHNLVNTSQESFEITPKEAEKSKDKSNRVPNPLVSAMKKQESSSPSVEEEKEELKVQQKSRKRSFFGFLNKLVKINSAPLYIKSENKTGEKNKGTANPNKTFSNHIVSISMFNTTLVIIVLDILYFFIYVYSVCLGISIHRYGDGFIYLLMVVTIAYQCDNGALLAGNLFGRRQFGSPVTPSKTEEGVIGGIFVGFLSAYTYRYIVTTFSSAIMMGHLPFFFYTSWSVFMAITGDFFESFLKRCADVKDSGSLLPGHGGLLDRIDSLTLCLPIAFYYLSNASL